MTGEDNEVSFEIFSIMPCAARRVLNGLSAATLHGSSLQLRL